MQENILSKLLTECPFPEVFEDTEKVEGCSLPVLGARSDTFAPTTTAGAGTIPCGRAIRRLPHRRSVRKLTAFTMS